LPLLYPHCMAWLAVLLPSSRATPVKTNAKAAS
jgi:hypothetical protein